MPKDGREYLEIRKKKMNKDFDLDNLIKDIMLDQHMKTLHPELKPKKVSKFWKTFKWIFTGKK